MIKLTGMWRNEGKNGEYFSGSLGSGKVLLFENKYKRKDTDPSHILYLAEKQDKDGAKPEEPAQQSGPSEDDSDVPF